MRWLAILMLSPSVTVAGPVMSARAGWADRTKKQKRAIIVDSGQQVADRHLTAGE